MSRVRRKLAVIGLGNVAFFVAVLLHFYVVAEVIAVAALLYRHYGSPKLAPPPAITRPFGIAIGVALLISLVGVAIPLNLPPNLEKASAYVLFVTAGLGWALMIANDVRRFIQNSVRVVFPPGSPLRDIALQYVDAEANDTIELWLPIGSLPYGILDGSSEPGDPHEFDDSGTDV